MAAAHGAQGHVDALLDVYERALPEVFGYLVTRLGDVATAEDLASDTFVGALKAVQDGKVEAVSTAWLVGIARHKLVDHWRAREREDRSYPNVPEAHTADPWETKVDALDAQRVLARLGQHHRAALTLRYLDGLPVGQLADILGRTEDATEALLVRARRAFRRVYEEGSEGG